MDKETLSNYGWIVILVLILAVMLALATPFGNFIADGFKATYAGFGMVSSNALQVAIPGSNTDEPDNATKYKENFEDNTWEEIIEACQKNEVPDTWVPGDKKNMTINGTECEITIAGKNHDEYTDGSGMAPLTFVSQILCETVMSEVGMNGGNGNWETSTARTKTIPQLLNVFPDEIKGAIKSVNKKSASGLSSGDESEIKTTSDKLFMLSIREIIGSIASRPCYAQEGEQYAVFASGNYTRVDNIVMGSTTTRLPNNYYSRSPGVDNNTSYVRFYADGSYFLLTSTAKCGVVVGFCF